MQPFTYEEGSINKRTGDAPTLAYQLAVPPEPKGAVLLVHGYGEHGGRYRRVVQKWANQGLAVAVLDLRGHGWSAGARGHCERFGEYHDDLDDVLTVFREHVPFSSPTQPAGVPLFGFGHSFGGLVVTTYALSRSSMFRGLVLSSPYFGLEIKVPPAKRMLGEVASKVWPSLQVPTGLTGKDVTHDETLARLYDNDPLVNKVATARWFTEAIAAQHDLLARASQLTTPVLLMQAGADRVVSPAASRAVFDRFSSSDKTYDERAGLYHEILNEPQGDEIADQMASWILARL